MDYISCGPQRDKKEPAYESSDKIGNGTWDGPHCTTSLIFHTISPIGDANYSLIYISGAPDQSYSQSIYTYIYL